MRFRYAGLVLIGLALLVAAAPEGRAQGGGRFYRETGHTLAAPFVAYFDAHGGLPIYGYPLTEAEMETALKAKLPDLDDAERASLARLSGGSIGTALVEDFDGRLRIVRWAEETSRRSSAVPHYVPSQPVAAE